jgi:hypothetical protein
MCFHAMRSLWCLALLVPGAAGSADGTVGEGAAAVERPALVLVIVVDQLRRDRLDPGLPGGLGRLARDGRVYREGVLDHAMTQTCPGHATILTGRHPGKVGVVANEYVDPKNGERYYCVEDRAPDAAILGEESEPSQGRSPRAMRVDALGDWLKAAEPGARVFAVSAKDRSAITLAGNRPDAAYWFVRGDDPRFTTSRYYRAELPQWVQAWNAVGLAARVPSVWEHAADDDLPADAPADDYPGESDEHGRTGPHPLRSESAEDAEEVADRVYRSPYLDAVTLDFARSLVEAEDLGRRGGLDLLAVSLSATDTVGHTWGPDSREARDALGRLDGWLGELLSALEARVGAGRLLVVLSSDHGVMPLPERLEETGRLTCPLPGGRQGLALFVLRLYAQLHFELSPFSWPRPWFDAASQLTVNRTLAKERGVPVDQVVAVAERWLEAQPSVREAWTRAEILEGTSETARLYRNSYDPSRSGDIAVQFEETCLPDFHGTGTSHGSPYEYDRAVPIVLWGAGIEPGVVSGAAATIDVAPTLAGLLGVAVPSDLDGRNLLVRER